MHADWRSLKVDTFNLGALTIALADKVEEITRSALTLALDLDSLLSLSAQVLEALVEADPEVVSRNAEDLANGGGDARGVGVNIIQLSKLSRDFGSKARRQRVRNLLQNIGGGGNSYDTISDFGFLKVHGFTYQPRGYQG
jgi:hypothetical protein